MKTIEDVPLFGISLKITKFWSLLIVENWRRYACIIPYAVVNLSAFADLYYSQEPIDTYIRNAYTTVLFFNGIVRSTYLCIKRRRYEELMDTVRELYIELMYSDVLEIREMLLKATNLARTLGNINLVLGTAVAIGFNIYPLFATGNNLPYGLYIPVIDIHKSPYYEVLYAINVILAPIGPCLYMPFSNIIVAFIIFGILMCKVLQYKLRQLQHLPPKAVRPQLISCIRYHFRLVSFVGGINSLNSYIFLMEFLTVGAMICALLFSLVIVEGVCETIIITCFIITIFSQNLMMYYCANELYVQSLNIAIAAYDINWYELDTSSQKILLIFLQRAQKPCSILLGNIYPMNLELLKSLVNVSYTYFTVLRRVYE